MLSKLLAIPFLIAVAVLTYLTIMVDELWSPYIPGPILALVAIYMLEPQIDWFWYKRFPPKLDDKLRQILVQNHKFYQNLSKENKIRFRSRMALYMEGIDFMQKGPEKFPEDMKGFIAANAVQVSFGNENFLMQPFERIVLYFERFPTPKYQTILHASELFEEDGVLLFQAQELVAGITREGEYYNIGMHEYAHVFTKVHANEAYPKNLNWEDLEKISGIKLKTIEAIIGLPDTPIIPVSIHHFFVFPEKFNEFLPEVFKQYVSIFNQNPLNQSNPVVDMSTLKDTL